MLVLVLFLLSSVQPLPRQASDEVKLDLETLILNKTCLKNSFENYKCLLLKKVMLGLDKARYGAEYRFFELLVNMVNAENVVNMVNIIEAGEEKMIYVRDI